MLQHQEPCYAARQSSLAAVSSLQNKIRLTINTLLLGGLGSFGSLVNNITTRFQLQFWSYYPKPLARIINKVN